MGALPDAGPASDAESRIHMGLAGVMHLHLACPGAAAHADVLKGSAKACRLMALEMGQGYEDIRVHDSPSYLGFPDILPIHGHKDIVRTF